jgi:hypothetical protein
MLSDQSTSTHREKLLLLIAGEWISRAIYVATKLHIADYLEEGPKSIQELVTLSQSHPESLTRILRTLTGFGVFEERTPGVFANSKTSSLLSQSNADTLYATSIYYGEDVHKSWDELFNSLKTGIPAFELVFKQPVFNYFKDNPSRGTIFHEAMKAKSLAVSKSALTSYNFGQFHSICDIGGGYGHFVKVLLNSYPHLNGIVFDLPEVINEVRKNNHFLDEARSQLCAGDFFVSVPPGIDAYLLKSVLHDWDNAKAEQILRICHQAMRSDSRLLIVEIVLLPKDQSVYANCMDLMMLTLCGGEERTLNSFEHLLDHSGFILEKVYPTSTEFSILEVIKK